MNVINLIVDGLVTTLLVVTVFYCWMLNRRLKALHTGKDGLKDVIAGLDRATERAQASLGELKTVGGDTAAQLKGERERAYILLDELKLILGSADRIANRLTEIRPQVPAPSPEKRTTIAMRELPSGDIYKALRQAR